MVRKYRKTSVVRERIEWDTLHDEELVPSEIAARFLGVSVPFVKKWAGRKFPVFKIGATSKFKLGDLRAYRESCCVIKHN